MSAALLANPVTGNPVSSRTQPLYDSGTIATANTTELSFFSVPINNGTSAFHAGAKSFADTNMRQSGLLPNGWGFTVGGIALVLWSTAATKVADLETVLTAMVLRVRKGGDTDWLQIPGKYIGGGIGLSGFAATAVGGTPLTIQTVHNGDANPDCIYRLAEPITIAGGEGFDCILEWKVAPTPTASVAAQLMLHGRMVKS